MIMELEDIRKNLAPQRYRVGAKWLYMGGCLCAMRVMLCGVLRGAAWCCVVCCGDVLRIPTWCCVVLHDAAW